MSTAVSTFSAPKLTRALKAAAKAGRHVSLVRIFDDGIELEFDDDPPPVPMTEAELLDGLEAIAAPEEGNA